jgi:hypothetical protein
MLKLIATLCLTIALNYSVLGQSTSYYIKYDYDAAGNRISRKCLEVTLRSANVPIDTSGVEGDLNNFKVTIYPNPTKGAIVVGIPSYLPNRKIELTVFSSDGKTLKQMIVQADRTFLDLSTYSSGLYLLLVKEGEKSIECKIVKQ